MDRLQMQIRNSNISVSFLLKVRDHPERVQKGKCKANSGKKKKKRFMHFDPDARVFVLSSWQWSLSVWLYFPNYSLD